MAAVSGFGVGKKPKSSGGDLKQFGESVAERVDKVVKKNGFDLWGDPWTIQGLPLIFPSSSNGFHLGLRLLLNNMKRRDPHELEVEAQLLASDKGRYKHSLRVDAPHTLGGKYRFTTRLSFSREISFPYFGFDNSTVIDPNLGDDHSYYSNTRSTPAIDFLLLRYIGGKFRTGPVMGFRWSRIAYPIPSLLDRDRPPGVMGGRSHYVGWAIIYDGLDFEPYPTVGSYHELFFTLNHPSVTASEYEYYRTTYTWRKYYPLHHDLTLAHRLILENLNGDVPYYEMGSVGGSDSTIGLGGDRYFRGYKNNQFIDKLRVLLGFELRWNPVSFEFANQDIMLGFVPFVDLGRVWKGLDQLEVGTIHASTGLGARLIWNRRLVIRADFAVSPEGTGVYLNLNHSF